MTNSEEDRRTEQRLVHGEKIVLYTTTEHIVLGLSNAPNNLLGTLFYELGIPLNRKECILLARDLLDIASTHVPIHKTMDVAESPFALEPRQNQYQN